MFSGTFTPKLDDKGRLFLPAKFRDEMKEGLVITRGQDRSLEVRTAADFASFSARLRESTDSRKRGYTRMLFALLSEQTPDKQGRITIPPMLRSYAGLQKECVVIGAMNRVEIWDAGAWAEYEASQEQAFSDLSEDVFRTGY